MIDWTFEGTWPHPPKWHTTPEGRMHYVDVGAGRPVVLAHGNPSWGYLFRGLIPPLVAAGHRVIVPDHLGFGRSDLPAFHSMESHATRFAGLMDTLGLQDVTLGVHDWGGPIALPWATAHPDRVRSLVVFNSFVRPAAAKVAMPFPLRLMRLPIFGELLARRLHLIVRAFLFGGGVRRPLSAITRRAYEAPHPSYASRAGILAWARQYPGDPQAPLVPWLTGLHRDLSRLADRPALILWSPHDPVFDATILAGWQADLPRAETTILDDAGHFALEDAPDAILERLLPFLGAAPLARSA
jgi:pimeloyl-ACP methyl ester carboxylesterase